jgi:hypothetical protein
MFVDTGLLLDLKPTQINEGCQQQTYVYFLKVPFSPTIDRCYDFFKYFRQKIRRKIDVFDLKQS